MPRAIRRHGPSLLVVAITGSFALPHAAAQGDAQPPATALPGVRPPPETGSPSDPQPDRGWGMAPVRWGGEVSAERRATDNEGNRFSQTQEYLNLRAATYVWQPWFVQLSGSLGLLLTQGSRGADDAAFGGSSDRTTVNGSLALAVFPQSRFPFLASYASTDSRTSDTISSVDTLSQRLTLRQDYRNPVGDTRSSLSLDHSQLSSQLFGKDRVDVLTGTFNRSFANQSLDVLASQSRNSRSGDQFATAIDRLSAVHNYRLGDELTVNTVASTTRSNLPVNLDGAVTRSKRGFDQLSSFANWYPYTERPLTVNAGIRLAQADLGGGDEGGGSSRLANANASAVYRPTDNINLSGAASVQQATIGSQTLSITTQSVGAGYTIDPRNWGQYLYTASASAALNNVTGLPEGGGLNVGTNLNHSLNRQFPLSQTFSLGAGVTQTLAIVQTGDGRDLRTLGNNLGFNARYAPEGSLAGYASLSLGDARTWGGFESNFQLINLQVSGQVRFSRYASMSGNLTWQSARQDVETVAAPGSGRRTFSSGGLNFQHVRLFGVPQLRYVAIASVFDNSLTSRRLGDPDALVENVTWNLEQRLEYLIGRLSFRATFRLAEIDGRKNALFFVRITRRFGQY